MIFILLDAWYFFRFEEKVVRHHFVDCTGEWENISVATVFMSEKNLRRTILSSLNVLCEMFVSKTGVSHISYLEEEFVIELYIDALPFEYAHVNSILNIFPILFIFSFFFLRSLNLRFGLWRLTAAMRCRRAAGSRWRADLIIAWTWLLFHWLTFIIVCYQLLLLDCLIWIAWLNRRWRNFVNWWGFFLLKTWLSRLLWFSLLVLYFPSVFFL